MVGLNYDNLLKKGIFAYRIDTGGALLYRAQGSPKGVAFGIKVDELNSLRSSVANQQSSRVFGSVTNAVLRNNAKKVTAISDAKIRELVTTHGPGGFIEKNNLANKLIARRNDIKAQILDKPRRAGQGQTPARHRSAEARTGSPAQIRPGFC